MSVCHWGRPCGRFACWACWLPPVRLVSCFLWVKHKHAMTLTVATHNQACAVCPAASIQSFEAIPGVCLSGALTRMTHAFYWPLGTCRIDFRYFSLTFEALLSLTRLSFSHALHASVFSDFLLLCGPCLNTGCALDFFLL